MAIVHCAWCGNEVNQVLFGRDDQPRIGPCRFHFSCIESVESATRTLASNLASAAMMERSRHLGVLDALQWLARQPMWPTWEPGCGKSAPDTHETHALCKAAWPALHREYGTVDGHALPVTSEGA